MAEVPRTRYVESGDGHYVAYQVLGAGDTDVVFLPTSWSNVESWWEDPVGARLLRRLASIGRLVLFDKRGSGLSDPVPLRTIPTVDEWVADLMVVLDAIGSARAHLVASDAGGAPALLAAAGHPDRVASIVLWNSFARLSRSDDYPIGLPRALQERTLAAFAEHFAEGMFTDLLAPSRARDAEFREFWARFGRQSVSLGTAKQMQAAVFALDVRDVLAAVRQPVLVLHQRDDEYVRPAHGRFMAEHLRNARYIELDGADHLPFIGDVDHVVDLIQEFVTGAPVTPDVDRLLATIVFTDIVGSTTRAASLGDRAWKAVLDSHDDTAWHIVQRFHGRQVKQTGDGILATFDGPTGAVTASVAMRDALHAVNLDIRCGVHTAEIERRGNDVGGIGVHVAARIAGLGNAGDVLVTGTVTDLVAGSGLHFTDRGEHTLKGVPGSWRVYAVAPAP